MMDDVDTVDTVDIVDVHVPEGVFLGKSRFKNKLHVSGRHATFVPIPGERKGYKFFHYATLQEVIKVANMQHTFADMGFGPKVYGLCRCEWTDPDTGEVSTHFGYITEAVDRIFDEDDSGAFFEGRGEFHALREAMQRYCLTDCYNHFNMGVLDGKPVVIDFSEVLDDIYQNETSNKDLNVLELFSLPA